jgi:hypothetical protein
LSFAVAEADTDDAVGAIGLWLEEPAGGAGELWATPFLLRIEDEASQPAPRKR